MYSQDSSALDNLLQILEGLGNTPISKKELFEKSSLVRKTIQIYPKSASRIGYQIDDETVDKRTLLHHFREASIYARKYGKCFLVVHGGNMLKPLKDSLDITEATFRLELKLSGDYYLDKSGNRFSHKSRTFFFYGEKTYQDPEYFDEDLEYTSILNICVSAIEVYESSIIYSKKILSNLSNLTIGIKDLGSQLRTEKGKRNLLQRLNIFDQNRRLDKAISYDLENEKIEYINSTVSQIETILEQFKDYYSACVDVPRDKIFNQQKSSNLASGYQNSIVHRFEWAVKVKEWSEIHFLPNLIQFYKSIGINSEITIPIVIELSEIEIAELEKIGAERSKLLVESKIISPKELRSGYQNERYTIMIKLDDKAYDEFISDSGVTKLETPKDSLETNEEINDEFSKDSLSDEEWDRLSVITFEQINDISEEMIND